MNADPVAQYEAVRRSAGGMLREIGLVSVRGPDATTFLQSLVSADLEPVGVGGGVHSLLLTPQGKLDVDFVLLRRADDLWLALTAPDDASRLVESLARFKIRVQVELGQEQSSVVEVRGPDATGLVAATIGADVPETPLDNVLVATTLVVSSPWPGLPGVELIDDAETLGHLLDELVNSGAVLVDTPVREALRIESGVARPELDLQGGIIPQEAFLDRDAVSFTKGCFLGQELVCRIDTRGHVNRYLRGVVAGEPLSPGAKVLVDGAAVGEITSVADSPRLGPVALAFVRREATPPAPIQVQVGAAGSLVEASLHELPISAGA